VGVSTYREALLDYLAVDWGSMEYPRILNLIDDYLDRLAEARQVLLELNGDSQENQKRESQAALNKRAQKAAARERQARLAFVITTSQPEAPRRKPISKSGKPASKRVTKASSEIKAGSFVQNELFSHGQPSELLHEDQIADAKAGIPISPIMPVPSSVKLRAQRKPTTPNKSASAPASRALGGTISAAPVFIPAERVRQENSQKATNKGTKEEASESTTATPLTVEMLTQRWVQGLTS
jgi:hypothetical protein